MHLKLLVIDDIYGDEFLLSSVKYHFHNLARNCFAAFSLS